MAVFDVIKFEGLEGRDWLVYRFPGDNFAYGSQLIVNEGQIAVFVKGGRATDFFSAGTYKLSSENIPILKSIINIPFGGKTPFSAEVYFINKTAKLDLLWGTLGNISLIDPKYNVRLRVRAFGQLGFRVSDFRVFLTELIGAVGKEQLVRYDIVKDYFKGVMITKIKSIIADIIINQKISVLEITPRLDEISSITSERMASEFERFGVEIVNFYINSINFPDEDFDAINKILSEKAAFDIFGDNRYNVKRTFDVMETSAGNEGGGNIAAAGIGLGMGAGAGVAIGGAFANSARAVMEAPAKMVRCTECGAESPEDSKFCPNCGGKMAVEQKVCPVCKALLLADAKFCHNCGTPMVKKKCPECASEVSEGMKFCNECGTKLEV